MPWAGRASAPSSANGATLPWTIRSAVVKVRGCRSPGRGPDDKRREPTIGIELAGVTEEPHHRGVAEFDADTAVACHRSDMYVGPRADGLGHAERRRQW